MKTLIAALGIVVISSAAFGQSAQPLSGPPASGGASQQAPAAGTAATQPRTVAQCREEARSQRLKGDERKKFVRECGRDITASCRDQAKSQRLDRDARRDFMATCTGRPSRDAKRRGTDAATPPSNTQSPSGTTAPAPR
jgi:hypothetical protein